MGIEVWIGIWGGVLSTLLGILKLLELRPKLFIKFTHIVFLETQELFITNIGKKAITIKEVGVLINRSGKELIHADPYDFIPTFPIFENNINPLPILLSEGEGIKFSFSVSPDEVYKKNRLIIYALDTRGKKFSTNKVNFFNYKFHYDMGDIRR